MRSNTETLDETSNLSLSYQNVSETIVNLTQIFFERENDTQRLTLSCDGCTVSGQSAIYVGEVCQQSITNGIVPNTLG